MRWRIAILGFMVATSILVGITAVDQSRQFKAGWAAFRSGDYATALRVWRPLAEHGHVKAQHNIGSMYLRGEGVPKDYAEAERWTRKAAEQGRAIAQYNLGWMYLNGLGVPRDYAKAAKWYRMAAEQKEAEALISLGLMYARGDGVPQDATEAQMWFSLVPPQGPKRAAEFRDNFAKRLTPAQLAEAQRLAREWTEEHGQANAAQRSITTVVEAAAVAADTILARIVALVPPLKSAPADLGMAMLKIGLAIAAIAILGAFLVSIRLSGPAIVVGAVLGTVVFAAGFFGPLIFMPESGIGPIMGILLGPVAFYVGGMGGFAWRAKRALQSPPRELNAYFIVLVLFALSPLFFYAGPARWWQEADVAENVATMPKDAPLGTLRIWTVDNGHWINRYGASSVPKMFGEAVKAAGGTASVEAISAEAFPRMLADAVARNQLPDIIASFNWRLIRAQFKRHGLWSRMVKVHSVLAPLASEGGLKSGLQWLGVPYLNRQSDKFELMRQVMLQIPKECLGSWSGVYGVDAQELTPLVKEMAAAYIARDKGVLSRYRDPAALSLYDDGDRAETDARVHGVVVCSLFGNDRLAFSKTVTVFEKPNAIGHQASILAVRRNGGSWRLLAVTSDTGPGRRISFQRSATAKALSGGSNSFSPDAPLLLSPENNARPQPTDGEKYGMFRWQPSDDANTAMEMLETACQNKRRAVFITLALQLKPPSHEEYIPGEQLASWINSEHTQCKWRVWRVARSGDIVFSEIRHIPVME